MGNLRSSAKGRANRGLRLLNGLSPRKNGGGSFWSFCQVYRGRRIAFPEKGNKSGFSRRGIR